MKTHRMAWAVLSLAAVTLLALPAHAQLDSNQANVQLNAVLAESLSVSATPGLVNFALAGAGVSPGDAPIAITTTWALSGSRTNVSLHAYFSSSVALTDGTNNIPTSNVHGSVNGGGFGPFTNVGAFSNDSIQVFSTAITDANRSATANDSLALQIDTTGLGLPAGTYTGTLNIQARAI